MVILSINLSFMDNKCTKVKVKKSVDFCPLYIWTCITSVVVEAEYLPKL